MSEECSNCGLELNDDWELIDVVDHGALRGAEELAECPDCGKKQYFGEVCS